MRRWIVRCALALASIVAAEQPFVIRVIDDETGRGVPLVELRTLNEARYYTDSNGVASITEPWLFGHDVYFRVWSHGYEFLEQIWGDDEERGKVLRVTPGGRAELKIRRRNVAERLYRITGAGIYRDSVMAGLPVPLKQPLLNARVVGQDTVVAVPYRGKIYWIWGDTFGLADALFSVSGATSWLPSRRGLDPDKGVDLTYFVDSAGFSRAMLPLPRPGLVWIEGMMTVRDPSGRERLLATYTRQPGLKPPDERGVAVFNDDKAVFEALTHWAGGRSATPSHPFRVVEGGKAYWYLYPHQRVRDDWRAIQDPRTWESFTCLKPGAVFDPKAPALDRAPDGSVRCGWKAGTDRIDSDEERELVRQGLLPPNQAIFLLIDVDTNKPTAARPGSVAWNDYRRRWIMIAWWSGSIYYSEADRPEGPWKRALKIISHDEYNFYNPTQHTFFDQDGGRVIYFEGTYTAAFTNAKEKTPLYDYNQIMYRLRLDDPRVVKAFGVASP